MTKLEDLGRVYTCDVLILGAGTAGIAAAHMAKDYDLDVLVLDRLCIGYNGQSTKAGHGFLCMETENINEFMLEQILTNPTGLWLNDQDNLRVLTEDAYHFHYDLQKYGAKFSHEEDGSIHFHKEFAEKPCSTCNIEMDWITPLIQNAKKRGVRMMERVYFTEILTDKETGRAIGAVGFDMETGEFMIFRSKVVINAGNAFNFSPGGMFMMGADSQIACYNAGAEFRNAEQSLIADLSIRNTEQYIYGMYHVIFNKNGENIAEKYHTNREQLTTPMIQGMVKEIREGNGPLYIDFTKFEVGEGGGWSFGQEWPKRLMLNKWINDHGGGFTNPKPEVSVSFRYLTQSVRVDTDWRTNVDGLYAPGSISMYGCAYGGWVHGDGVAYASRTGLRAGRAAAIDAVYKDLGEVDVEQVAAFKDHLYGPAKRTEGKLPTEYMKDFGYLILGDLRYTVERTEETMIELMGKLADMRADMEANMYIPADDDGYYLGKANEARCQLRIMEIILTATLARKESRGMATRADYPLQDDENMIKWVIVDKGDDGMPQSHYERIPFERYMFKPPNWTPEWITEDVNA